MSFVRKLIDENIELMDENLKLKNEVKELNKYVEYLEERLFKSESNNNELRDQVEDEKSRHLFYASKFKQLLLQDKYTKYRVYMS